MISISTAESLDEEAKAFHDAQWRKYDARYGDVFVRDGIAITARADGEIVGTLTGWMSMGVGYLTELIVSESCRKSGIGTHLLNAFEQTCKDKGQRRLALRTEKNGDGQPFYVKHGWWVEADIPQWLGGFDF